MSPECLKKGNTNGYCGKKSDVWSLGVCLYCYIFLELPFYKDSLKGLIDSIVESPLEITPKKEISSELKDLLQKMLTKNPEDRLSLIDVKKHPWFLKDD